MVDDLVRRPFLERVRLVVDDECAVAVLLQDVEPAVQENAVVLECERTLGPCTAERRDSARELGFTVGAHEAADPFQLLLADARVPAAHEIDQVVRRQRLLQVHELEQTVDGVADLRGREAGRAGRGVALVGGTHPDHALGVVTVGAALEQCERAERQATYPVEGRCRDLGERR